MQSTSARARSHILKRRDALQLDLTSDVVDKLALYFGLLARWNTKINLSGFALDAPSDLALDRLLIEPLFAAEFFPDSSIRWVDLGSGGGSPAIPIRLARPRAMLTMVESKGRKAAFLREAVSTLGLAGTSVAEARIDEFAASHESSADWLSVRGVRLTNELLKTARSILLPGGRLTLFTSAVGLQLSGDLPFRVVEAQPLPHPLKGAIIVLATAD